jgi:7-carboxy-7-deazaguanine synthase
MDSRDYEYARDVIRRYELPNRCTVLLSAVFGAAPPVDIVAWMLEDRLDARFQIQMHKVIWRPTQRGV